MKCSMSRYERAVHGKFCGVSSQDFGVAPLWGCVIYYIFNNLPEVKGGKDVLAVIYKVSKGNSPSFSIFYSE